MNKKVIVSSLVLTAFIIMSHVAFAEEYRLYSGQSQSGFNRSASQLSASKKYTADVSYYAVTASDKVSQATERRSEGVSFQQAAAKLQRTQAKFVLGTQTIN